ncbi:MAG: ATP-grasp domain-containing protein [Planctomycetes bacterium]|nr:ATP-grasp domain-containing protein [Planctomycetota bacterium]
MLIALLVDRASLTARSPSENLSRTARDIRRALRARGHDCVITTLDRLKRLAPDIVFNLCESLDGDPRREPEAVEAVERMGLRITGNPARALRTALDKARAKALLRRAGVRVPMGCPASACVRPHAQLRFPLIVKPRCEDASIGIDHESVVESWEQARRRAAQLGGNVIIEEYVDGREFNAALLSGRVLAISEIGFSGLPQGSRRIVTYAGKWRPRSSDYRGTVPICPARVRPALARRLRAAARKAFRTLHCRGPARVDMRVDSRERVFVLEVNPNPDLAADAGFARAARAHGWSYQEMVERILHAH